jgi:hypothetical protein
MRMCCLCSVACSFSGCAAAAVTLPSMSRMRLLSSLCARSVQQHACILHLCQHGLLGAEPPLHAWLHHHSRRLCCFCCCCCLLCRCC